MKVQVLASVMNQSFDTIVNKMRLDSDAVIINQCDRMGFEEKENYVHLLLFYSFHERGIVRSRN